jgi:Na+/melibiose symporter-like transporter
VDPSRDPTRPWAPSPFKRLARTHALSVAGDAMFTTAMAGLVFFNVSDLGQARWRVAMALIFTILPFSVAAPFIGPLIDRARGGRKWMIVGLSAGRALICLLLVWGRDSPWALYPEFLLALVCAKGYVIAKGALVPTTVHSDAELVQANAKLAAISGVAAVAGGAPSLLVMWIASKFGSDHGPDLALALASVVYLATIVQAAQLPSVRVADEPADEAEISELRTAGIRHAAQAVSLIRGTVGFLTFLLAFHFKDLEATDSTASKVGLVGCVVGAQIGFMLGAAVAPPLRKQLPEERMLMGSLGLTTIAGLLTALMGDLAGATLLSFTVGLTANTAKQAFDAIVQRDAPDANRGRAFARFETRFQLVWVIGALLGCTIGAQLALGSAELDLELPIKLGFLLIAICSGVALTLYMIGLRDAMAESKRRPSPLAGEPTLVEPQPASRSFLRRRPSVGAAEGSLDPTLVSVAPADRVVAPSGIDSTMVVAPATVAAAPTASAARNDPTQVLAAPGFVPTPGVPLHRPVTSGGPADVADPHADRAPLAAGVPPVLPSSTTPWRAAPVKGQPSAGRPAEDPSWSRPAPGLFGTSDAPIQDAFRADPDTGLFAVRPPAPEPVVDPSGPVFYDGAAWVDEDDTNPGHPLPGASPTGMYDAPPAPPGGPVAAPAPTPPADPPRPFPEPPAAPPPFVNEDGSYPEPLWRDSVEAAPAPGDPAPGDPAPGDPAPTTPPLPGFEPAADTRAER